MKGAFNSAEVQQCRKRRESFRINYTHFLKSGKLMTLIIKENHSDFGANMSATAKLNNYFGAKTSKLQIFVLKILKFYTVEQSVHFQHCWTKFSFSALLYFGTVVLPLFEWYPKNSVKNGWLKSGSLSEHIFESETGFVPRLSRLYSLRPLRLIFRLYWEFFLTILRLTSGTRSPKWFSNYIEPIFRNFATNTHTISKTKQDCSNQGETLNVLTAF